MSNVLSELLREKQTWIEHHKCRHTYLSRFVNITVTIAIGFAIVKFIEHPESFWNLLKLFV